MRFRPILLVAFLISNFLLLFMSIGFTPARSQSATPTTLPCQVELIREREFLTLYIAGDQCVSLADLQIEYEDSTGALQTYNLSDSFQKTTLARITSPTCFSIVLSNADKRFPEQCTKGNTVSPNRRFADTVNRSSVFWWDFDSGEGRDLTIYQFGQTEGETCPGSQSSCVLQIAPPPPTPTPQPTNTIDPSIPTMTPIPTSTTVATTPVVSNDTYPCPATITTARGTVLNVVREFPAGGGRTSVNAGQTIIILEKTPDSAREAMYKIRDGATGRDLGWIPVNYVDLSASCPK